MAAVGLESSDDGDQGVAEDAVGLVTAGHEAGGGGAEGGGASGDNGHEGKDAGEDGGELHFDGWGVRWFGCSGLVVENEGAG